MPKPNLIKPEDIKEFVLPRGSAIDRIGELSFSADASNEITVKKGSTSVSAGAFSIKGNVKVDADGTIKLE